MKTNALRFAVLSFYFHRLSGEKNNSPLPRGSGENKNFTTKNRKSYKNSPQKIYSNF